jgi:protein phosphatase
MYQLTKDHSLISEKIHAGHLTIEEAKNHCLKNVITRSVGFQAQEYVDVESFLLRDKDIFILSSDGLHGKLKDNEISTIVKKERLDAVDKLVDLAKDRGGEDNISVVIVEFQSQI